MEAADLGAVHLVAGAGRAGLRVERAQPGVGLPEGIVVDAGSGAHATVAAATRSAGRIAWEPDSFRQRHGSARLILVLETRHVATAVALELRLDPVNGGTVAVRGLAAGAEAGEALDGRLVALQGEPRDELGDGVRSGRGVSLRRQGGRKGESGEQQEGDERSVHAGTYAGTPGSATHVYLDLQRTIRMKIEIATRDGLAPSYVFRPEGPGKGPWPAVLVFMDGIGIRPAMLEIGERLATYGNFVLLPDLYYRSGPYAPLNAKTEFADPDQRQILMERVMSKGTLPALMSDTEAFLEFLASDRAVRPGGCCGSCHRDVSAAARLRVARHAGIRRSRGGAALADLDPAPRSC